MASKLLISINFLFAALVGRAQTADFYFHDGSKHYVFGEKAKAKAAIDTGLAKFPQDPQLNSLAGLIKKEEKEKKPSSGDKNKDQEKDKDQKSESRQKNEKSEAQDSAKTDEEPQEKDSQAKDEQEKQEQQQQQQNGKEPGEKEGEQQEATAMAAGQMTPEQARQFLDAQKQEDKALIFAPQKDPKQMNRKLKDW